MAGIRFRNELADRLGNQGSLAGGVVLLNGSFANRGLFLKGSRFHDSLSTFRRGFGKWPCHQFKRLIYKANRVSQSDIGWVCLGGMMAFVVFLPCFLCLKLLIELLRCRDDGFFTAIPPHQKATFCGSTNSISVNLIAGGFGRKGVGTVLPRFDDHIVESRDHGIEPPFFAAFQGLA